MTAQVHAAPAAPRQDSPSRALYRYTWKLSGRSQIVLAALAVATLLLDLVPLELQRRIVNGALDHRSFDRLLLLCAIYGGVALLQGGTKFALNLCQAAVSERANRKLRLDASTAVRTPPDQHNVEGQEGGGQEGIGISIIVSEVEAVGGFVGSALPDLVLHGGVLVTVFGYLTYLQPWMALIGVLLFGPQLLFVPLLQHAINQRTAARIKILRGLSVEIVKQAGSDSEGPDQQAFERDVRKIYDLNLEIFRRKFGMNFLMNLLHHLAIAGILLVGGLFVIDGRTEVGTVVAFISGLSRINDPWGDLVNYFRDLTNAAVKFQLIRRALPGDQAPTATAVD